MTRLLGWLVDVDMWAQYAGTTPVDRLQARLPGFAAGRESEAKDEKRALA